MQSDCGVAGQVGFGQRVVSYKQSRGENTSCVMGCWLLHRGAPRRPGSLSEDTTGPVGCQPCAVSGELSSYWPIVQRLRALLEAAVADLPPGRLSHTIMFEAPSACLEASEFFELIDFGCIKTNDWCGIYFAPAPFEPAVCAPRLMRLIQKLAEGRPGQVSRFLCAEILPVIRDTLSGSSGCPSRGGIRRA
jgi:hypothetical protein